MVSVNDFLSNLTYGGKSLYDTGAVDASAGGFTDIQAPFIFASLLKALGQPGGPLSPLATDTSFAGQMMGMTSAGQQARTAATQQLATQGVNPGQAASQLSGLDEQLTQQLMAARAQAEEQHGQEVQEASTQLANVVAQSSDTAKQRTEQVRQYEEMKDMMEEQSKWQKTLGIAGLALNMFPGIGTALGQGLGGLFGGESTMLGQAFLPTTSNSARLGLDSADAPGGGLDLPAAAPQAPMGGPAGLQSMLGGGFNPGWPGAISNLGAGGPAGLQAGMMVPPGMQNFFGLPGMQQLFGGQFLGGVPGYSGSPYSPVPNPFMPQF